MQTDEYAEVRPPVTGTVSKIFVFSGDKVKAGDLLVQLNAEEEEATLAETCSRLSRLQVNLSNAVKPKWTSTSNAAASISMSRSATTPTI